MQNGWTRDVMYHERILYHIKKKKCGLFWNRHELRVDPQMNADRNPEPVREHARSPQVSQDNLDRVRAHQRTVRARRAGESASAHGAAAQRQAGL